MVMVTNQSLEEEMNYYDDDEYVVRDDNGKIVSPLDDDYGYWKHEQEYYSNPLSDDYCKYRNEQFGGK